MTSEDAGGAEAGDRRVDLDGEALAREVVHHVEGSQARAVHELVRQKSTDHRSFGAVGGGRTVRSADASRLRCFHQ